MAASRAIARGKSSSTRGLADHDHDAEGALEETEDDKKLDRLVFGVPQSEVETELGSVIRALNFRLTSLSSTYLEHQRNSNDLVALNAKLRETKKKQTAEVRRMTAKSDGVIRSLDDGDFDESRLVFLTKPHTETAKRLEARLDEVHGMAGLREAKGKSQKSKRREGEAVDQRVQAKKLIRAKLEKDLQSSMEAFMTRSITEISLSFRAPEDLNEEPSWPISINWPAPDPRNKGVGNSLGEMCPDVLLEYSLERVRIPSGRRMFRSLLRLPCLVEMYVYLFWLCKIRLFQMDYSDADEHFLAGRLSIAYSSLVAFITETARAQYEKDFVFRYLPFILSNAVHFGYYFLCPGSRHLLTRSFRKAAFILVTQFMFGVRITSLTLKVIWTQVFPEDLVQDGNEDDEEFQPLSGDASASLMESGDRFTVASLSKSLRMDSPCIDVMHSPYGGTRVASSRRKTRPLSAVDNSLDLADTADVFNSQAASVVKQRERPVLARQRSSKLNLHSLSPLMRAFYTAPRKTREKSVQLLKVTVPVSNCVVGGTDTYKRRSLAGSMAICDEIAAKNNEILHKFERVGRDGLADRRATLNTLTADKRLIMGDSKLTSSKSLELMKRKLGARGGYRETSITSSAAKDSVTDE